MSIMWSSVALNLHVPSREQVANEEATKLRKALNVSDDQNKAGAGDDEVAMSIESDDWENDADHEDNADDEANTSNKRDGTSLYDSDEEDEGQPLPKKRDLVGSRERQVKVGKVKRPLLSPLIIPNTPYLKTAVAVLGPAHQFLTVPPTLKPLKSSYHCPTVHGRGTGSSVDGGSSPLPNSLSTSGDHSYSSGPPSGYVALKSLSLHHPEFRLNLISPVKPTMTVGDSVL